MKKLPAWLSESFALVRRFKTDSSGQIAVLFAVASTSMLFAIGGGIDLSMAYLGRQKLSEVAVLACQYATRPSVIQAADSTAGTAGLNEYIADVNGYITKSLTQQKFQYSQTTSAPFTAVANGAANVTLTANVPTIMTRMMGVTQIPINAASRCYDNKAAIPPIVPDGNSPYVVKESFESGACAGCYSYTRPDGSTGTNASATSTFPSSPSYIGTNGTAWHAMGYCLEIDSVGTIKPVVADGSFSAELDCHNNAGTGGNSSISTKAYLAAGTYELRYNYSSRVAFPNYTPSYICGSTASDVSWANDSYSVGGPVANAVRTNQMNVYLDLNTTGSPPTHATIDGAQTLAGSNLIDVCVYSFDWVERSVRINVTTPGYYWLSFAADGRNDTYGPQVDHIRLCRNTCPGPVGDNFPTAWEVSGGKVLFGDTFDLPAYTAQYPSLNVYGNMNNSMGTSGTASSGWTGQAASGWGVGTHNQMDYILSGSAQGTQSIELDSNNPSGTGNSRRLISRPFLLDPGYYRVNYSYISGAIFSTLSGVYCGATPTAANVAALTGSGSAAIRYPSMTQTLNRDTNIVGVFMSHAQLASTPISGNALGALTSYNNPNGTTSTTPTVAPDGISLTAYNAAQPNPLLDMCGYANTWQSRSANIKIQKPGYYWLTFAALGTTDTFGATIDDVKLTALGSLYTTPPANAVAIPVPSPQPGAALSFTGFSIIADPLVVPAS